MPGYDVVNTPNQQVTGPLRPLTLRLAYTEEDPEGSSIAAAVSQDLHDFGVRVTLVRFPTLRALAAVAGPPARADIDMVLLGWSPKIFDEYNILDLFPCGSAFNVARWCSPMYDRSMRAAVRTLDDRARWQIERLLVNELQAAAPAVPLYTSSEYVRLAPGVRGFSWSPIGFYELDGLTRS
jgi:ABC-type transport system substrate-binding protein